MTSINLDEYSESSTIIKFPKPIPLLRHPAPLTNPPITSLAFRNTKAFKLAHTLSLQNISHQCESASRIGCSVTASNNCSPPWWRTLLPASYRVSDKEREECEEREMMTCMEVSKVKCGEFASEKCWNAFKDARVVVGDGDDDDVKKRVVEMIDRVCFRGNRLGGKSSNGVKVVRGSDLLMDKRF